MRPACSRISFEFPTDRRTDDDGFEETAQASVTVELTGLRRIAQTSSTNILNRSNRRSHCPEIQSRWSRIVVSRRA